MSNNTKQFSIRETFDLAEVPEHIMIEGAAEPGPFTPQVEEHKFSVDLVSDVLGWYRAGYGDGLLLTGPTGAGKSSLICQIASRLNWNVQRVVGHSRLEFPEVVGQQSLIGGDTVFIDGPLAAAMREGHIFLLDEMDLLDPATLAGFNAILEGDALVVTDNGGEVVKPHPNFRFVATGNSAGGGDHTGMYDGILKQNAATMDRFWVVEVDYPDKETEMEILAAAVPGLHESIRSTMIDVANKIRELFMGNNGSDAAIEVTMSTRSLIRWARLTELFKGKQKKGVDPVTYALDRALANRASPETKTALHEIVQRLFK